MSTDPKALLLSVTIPVELAQVPAEVQRLQAHIRALRAAIEATSSLLAAVRAGCAHETTESGSTWGRDSWTRCTHCKKEW